jgi:hypothetical protein
MVHETGVVLQLQGSTQMRLDPLAEVRFVKVQLDVELAPSSSGSGSPKSNCEVRRRH